MVSEETLVSLFTNLGSNIQDKAAVDKCLQLCNAYGIDEETLAELWVGYSSSHDLNFHPTVQTLTQMENDELKEDINPVVEDNNARLLGIESETENICDNVLDIYSTQPPVSKSAKRPRSPNAEAENEDSKLRAVDLEFVPDIYTALSTPGRSQSTVFRGKVLLNFGPKVQRWEKQNECEISISKSNMPHIPKDAVYMYDMLSKQGRIVTESCVSFGKRLGRIWNKTGPLFTHRYVRDVTCISQIPFRTWGRVDITLDKSSNTKIVFLEGSIIAEDIDNTPLIRLDLSGVKHYSLFSGQVVAVEGINSVGDTLVVSEIFSKGYAPIPETPPTLTSDLRIYVAVGPFTASDNVTYQPLWDLMGQVAKDEPDMLILVGPLVDCDHPEILKGTLKDTFRGFFDKILSRVMQCLQGKSTRIVLVSSNRDIHHHPVFPTPEFIVFPKKIGSDVTNLHLMPDPCVINVCGLQIGVTSVDVIKHLGQQEVSHAPGMDRLGRLANHVLSQTTFYPLYPPHMDLNVDIYLLKKYGCFEEQPHIMILPSDVKYFCTAINECLVLNPERMLKNIYAKLYVRPTSDGKWDPNNVSCEIAKV